jgi:PadR family transcriptional regulator, regulatory protein PadR
MESVVPRDHFRASLLLLLEEVPTHGYDLLALLGSLGLGSTDRGFVYRTLRAMEADGLVASAWDSSPAGPARRIYTVTPAGAEWAIVASVSLREVDRHMGVWLARYRSLSRRGGPQSLPGVPEAS